LPILIKKVYFLIPIDIFIFDNIFLTKNNKLNKINKKFSLNSFFEKDTPLNFLIVTHVNPDGDAIGSALGLYHVMKNMSLNVEIMVPNNFPSFLKWIPGTSKIHNYEYLKKKGDDILNKADTIFCLDFNAESRLGNMAKSFMSTRAKKVLIDHHPNPENFCEACYSDTRASSTAEIIYHLLTRDFGKEYIDKDSATSLYTGILTDTGSFSFNSSNPGTFRTIAEILEYGIDKDKIYSNVYDNYSENRMHLLGYTLYSKMKVLKEYQTAYIYLNEKELEDFNFKIGDTEGFVNYPFSIKDIRFTALFLEKKEHVKISFRSKGDFSCNNFARKHFDGGGHRNAAGGESKISLDDTINKFLNKLPDYKDQLLT